MENVNMNAKRHKVMMAVDECAGKLGAGGYDILNAIVGSFAAGIGARQSAAEVKAENPKKEESGETEQD